MCGIAGVLSLTQAPIDPMRARRMCDALAHRGPDDAGYAFFRQGGRGTRDGGYWVEFADERFRHLNEHLPSLPGEYAKREIERHRFDLALGHRRLSILDLSHLGHQPMSSSDRLYWTVFNGEIYNFPELKRELQAKGRVFRTTSDTEVLLQLWEEEGTDCVERLNGMFAFALYDRTGGKLFLVRDRFGVKPLYYADTGAYLVFASEPKGVLASGLLEPRLDPASLAEYMTFQNLFGDRVIFGGMRLLPPGCLVEVDVGAKERRMRELRYAHATGRAHAQSETFEKTADAVLDAFQSAVERQLISDVPVGAYLSGGMDSGSIVAVAARFIPRLTTFTGGFDLTNVSGIEQGFDERPQAERLSYLMQTEHYAVVLHAGDMPAAMERLAWHVDDPRLGMCHQNWYVAKLASRFVKVCLAGAGGDELFGGYPWRYRPALEAQSTDEFDESYFHYWHRLLPRERLSNLLGETLRAHLGETRDAFQAMLDKEDTASGELDRPSRLLERALRFEFRTFLHGFLLIEDRLSMAHGLESRVPFLDNALAALAWEIPPHFKVDLDALSGPEGRKHLETEKGKLVLRKAMERLLPPEFTRQKKQGFSPPDANWYRGPSLSYVKEILLDPLTLGRGWFDEKVVRSTLDEHFRGEQNHRLLIWSLLSLEWLQRHFTDSPPWRTP
ncbi:MAG TPA: asparagine synthase (glutamine-hydrolyzing) [Myxococcota bacterium]|nr:asparagine synthase (glutamine-hydrolyzing) [Myxococcota bacterium]